MPALAPEAGQDLRSFDTGMFRPARPSSEACAGAKLEPSNQPDPGAAGGSQPDMAAIKGPAPEAANPPCVGNLLALLQGLQTLPAAQRPHRIEVNFQTAVLTVFPDEAT